MTTPLLSLWTRLFSDTLTPRQVDADLRRHNVDPQRIRALVDALGRDLDPSFAAGVLAGIRFSLLSTHALRHGPAPAAPARGRGILFPSPQTRSA